MTPIQALQILQKEFENNKNGSIANLEQTFICLLREIEIPEFPQDYKFDMVVEKKTNKEKLRPKKRIIHDTPPKPPKTTKTRLPR